MLLLAVAVLSVAAPGGVRGQEVPCQYASDPTSCDCAFGFARLNSGDRLLLPDENQKPVFKTHSADLSPFADNATIWSLKVCEGTYSSFLYLARDEDGEPQVWLGSMSEDAEDDRVLQPEVVDFDFEQTRPVSVLHCQRDDDSNRVIVDIVVREKGSGPGRTHEVHSFSADLVPGEAGGGMTFGDGKEETRSTFESSALAASLSPNCAAYYEGRAYGVVDGMGFLEYTYDGQGVIGGPDNFTYGAVFGETSSGLGIELETATCAGLWIRQATGEAFLALNSDNNDYVVVGPFEISTDGGSGAKVALRENGFLMGMTALCQYEITSALIAVVVGVVVGCCCLVAAVAACIFFALKKKRAGKTGSHPDSSQSSDGGGSAEMASRPLSMRGSVGGGGGDDLKIITNIEVGLSIGAGSFGDVYRGTWQDTTDVALKKLRGGADELRDFATEARTLQKLDHPHVVRFFGVYVEPANGAQDPARPASGLALGEDDEAFGYSLENNFYMVTEFMAAGGVDSLLQRLGPEEISGNDLVFMALDTAAGMRFLATEGIVHRDLSARNLLARKEDSRYRVKVSDFGLSRSDAYSSTSTSKSVFPVKWSPPEVLEFERFSEKSDVYSFAITVWELLSYGRVPWMGMSNQQAMEAVLKGERMSRPEGEYPDAVWDLVESCWAPKADARPTFADLCGTLRGIINDASEGGADLTSPAHQDDFYNTPTTTTGAGAGDSPLYSHTPAHAGSLSSSLGGGGRSLGGGDSSGHYSHTPADTRSTSDLYAHTPST